MKKTLNNLAKEYYKNNVNVDIILLSLLSVIDETNNEDDFTMMINMTSNSEIIKKIFSYATELKCLNEQIYFALIKIVSSDEGILLIKEMMKNNIKPHVRAFIALFNNYKSNCNEIVQLIENSGIVPNVELFTLLLRFSKDKRKIIEWSSYYCIFLNFDPNTTIKNGACEKCNEKLKIIDISTNQRLTMLANLKEFENNKEYDIVTDGANVAHYNNSPFDVKKVVNIIETINTLKDKKILIVFSICRRKATKHLINKWSNIDIYYVPEGINDDLCWLYVSIYSSAICITNDQIRDHINFFNIDRNIIDLWIERHIATFTSNCINFPLDYSVRPQVNEEHYHIPTKDGWYCSFL